MQVTELEQRAYVKIALLRGRNARECHTELREALGARALPYRTVAKWTETNLQSSVSPTELENIIMQLPGVADVAVVGIPDTLAGELPRAFVVRHHSSPNLTEADIYKHIEPQVASYKRLAGGVKFVNSIPRNPAGKVLRQQLKVLG